MTRKTKEEKKIAEYRRRLKLLEQNNRLRNLDESKKIKTVADLKTEESPKPSDKDIQQQICFSKDLKKSLFFICLIITLEIVIYFATMNRQLN